MKTLRLALILGVVALGASLAFTVHAQEGLGDRIEKNVGRAVSQIREGAKDVANQLEEGLEKVRASVDRMSVAGRVYARLRWDKALNDSSISVDVSKDGVTTLHGTVGNEAAKKKAEDLARDTVGVDRVMNDLEVAPTPPAK